MLKKKKMWTVVFLGIFLSPAVLAGTGEMKDYRGSVAKALSCSHAFNNRKNSLEKNLDISHKKNGTQTKKAI